MGCAGGKGVEETGRKAFLDPAKSQSEAGVAVGLHFVPTLASGSVASWLALSFPELLGTQRYGCKPAGTRVWGVAGLPALQPCPPPQASLHYARSHPAHPSLSETI